MATSLQSLFVLAVLLTRLAYSTTIVDASVKHDYWWLARLERVATYPCTTIDEHRDISIVQHFTLERLPVLFDQCDQWAGAIAAVLYLPLVGGTVYAVSVKYHNKPLSAVLDAVAEMHTSLLAKGCKVELGVYTESIAEVNEWSAYPSNTMRNMALDLARTDIVLPLDADFLVCPKTWGDVLHDKQEPAPYRQLHAMLQDTRTLLVLPAFEVLHNATPQGVHNVTKQGTKQALESAIEQGSATKFQSEYHANTQYDVWFNTSAMYATYYGAGKEHPRAQPAEYEPYFMAWRQSLPYYDERFRGYHFNKLTYLFYLHSLGFQYYVHPGAWVAHMPHARARERLPWEVGQPDHRRMRLAKIWHKEMPQAIASGVYIPVLAEQPFARVRRKIHTQLQQASGASDPL